MKKKLGNFIIAAFFINVFAIMSVGGVCILMVRDMVNNISRLEEESADVTRLDEMSDQIHKMIFSIHHFIIDLEVEHLVQAIDIIEQVEKETLAYKIREQNKNNPAGQNEILLLDKIQDNLTGMKATLRPVYDQFSGGGALDKANLKILEGFGNTVDSLTGQINKIHSEIITALVNDSYNRMYFILILYLTSSLVGMMASFVGYRLLTHHTVLPIKNLATATQKIAQGDLSMQVSTDSTTEIGTLYDSFNIMTRKLSEHEKRREDFNRELEAKVRIRTSELRESEESLKKAQSELIRMERIATLGQIATSVNHEIKTPLNSLYMNLQLLTKQINKCEREEEKVKNNMLGITSIINSEVIRINEILEEFVKYARFSPPEFKQNDLNKLLRDLAEMISQDAGKSKVGLELALADDLPPIMLDEKKMVQALLNLCVNALQAMPYGGTLTIASSRLAGAARIEIRDTGVGISPEDIDQVFEPFFTKKEGGLGFGLSIVQRIIEDHHGKIVCRSKPAAGTVFEITLPA